MSLYEKTINQYLEVACSSSPTPGGGSVSAVVATSAAAMVCMVANLTIGKKGYEECWDKAKQILDDTNAIIANLKELTAKDMAAFETYMAAFRLPKETEDQKKARKEAIQKEAKNATEIPLAIAKACHNILIQAEKLSHFGNKGAISDVGVAAYVADGAMRAAMFSVDINLPTIEDEEFVQFVVSERCCLFSTGQELKEKTVVKVRERMAGH